MIDLLSGIEHRLGSPLRLVLLLFATLALLGFLASIAFAPHWSVSHKFGVGGVIVLAYGVFFAIDAFADLSDQ